MLRRLAKIFILGTLVVSVGLHWTLLQSVAWVGMVVSFSQEESLSQAWVKTFDGKHPCKMCKFVEEGKKSDPRHESDLHTKQKLDSYLVSPLDFLSPPELEPLITRFSQFLPERLEVPLLPPPLLS